MSVDPQLNMIEEVAAAWMIERDRGLTPARERELARWLRADVRHAAAFNALAETWKMMSEVELATAAAGALAASPNGGRKFVWFPVALAAAAAIAIACLGWWQPRQRGLDNAGPVALAAATDVGILRTVNLPDGSVIQLNTDSAVDVRYEADLRRVRLERGEAHFKVAKDPSRPFIVTAAGVDVRVVGTAFNVRLRSESVDVLVTEGKVRVDSPVQETDSRTMPDTPSESLSELAAGQKVSIVLAALSEPAPVAPVDVSTVEIRQTLAWQTRRLDFDAAPLSDIVAEFNRYNRHKLIVADPALNAQRFGGAFPASDHETFVRMLEADFGVVAERNGEATVLRAKSP